MSVVILGMEMPGKCESCLLRYRHQGAYCTDHCYATPRHKNIDPWTFGRARNGDRPDWCPLRPLPEKHGRLVDADAMERVMSDTVQGDIRQYPYSDTQWEMAFKWLDHQPTIVEAEGD